MRWIGNLVSTTFFSILVNRAPSVTFQTLRGIRQGDPLSPFLFILLAEGLGRALKAQQAAGEISVIGPYEGMEKQTH